MRSLSSSLVCVVALAASAGWAKQPAPKPTPFGEALVTALTAVEGDRLVEFAPALGEVKDFPGTDPKHEPARADWEKKLATKLGLKSLKLDPVSNAMVGDDKNPPVTSLTLVLTDDQAKDAARTFEHIRLSKSTKAADGSMTWEMGRVTWVEKTRTLSWNFSKPRAVTPEWDAASLESTRKSIMAIVNDKTSATAQQFVEAMKKRSVNRSPAMWDDERVTYSFNVTDTSRFIEFTFPKRMDGAALLKDLGLTQVTFENPCDADFLIVLTEKAELPRVGKWEVELTTAPNNDYTGSVRFCTSNEKVKPFPADKLKLGSVRLSLDSK